MAQTHHQTDRRWHAVWLAACVLGFGYWLTALGRSGLAFEQLAQLPPEIQIPWKGACTLGLAVSVALAATGRSQRLIAGALVVSAIADMILVTQQLVLSGVLFSVSHAIAIHAFWRERDRDAAILRRCIAAGIPLVSFALSVAAVYGTDVPLFFALYPLLSGIMAATALLSRFPPWLCGLGAAVFICSDVLVLAWLGVFGRDPSFGFLTWLTYFGGYATLARGVAVGPGPAHR